MRLNRKKKKKKTSKATGITCPLCDPLFVESG
jgi:hypothetical protein